MNEAAPVGDNYPSLTAWLDEKRGFRFLTDLSSEHEGEYCVRLREVGKDYSYLGQWGTNLGYVIGVGPTLESAVRVALERASTERTRDERQHDDLRDRRSRPRDGFGKVPTGGHPDPDQGGA